MVALAINLEHEKPVKMKAVAQKFDVALRTVYGWTNRQRGPRLDSFKVGGERFTTWSAVNRFAGISPQQQQERSDAYRAAMDDIRNLNAAS
jgi:transposase